MTGVKVKIGILQFKDFYQRQTNNSIFVKQAKILSRRNNQI